MNFSREAMAIPVTGPVVSSDCTIEQKGVMKVVMSSVAKLEVMFSLSWSRYSPRIRGSWSSSC
jgi:hypothetical protein